VEGRTRCSRPPPLSAHFSLSFHCPIQRFLQAHTRAVVPASPPRRKQRASAVFRHHIAAPTPGTWARPRPSLAATASDACSHGQPIPAAAVAHNRVVAATALFAPAQAFVRRWEHGVFPPDAGGVRSCAQHTTVSVVPSTLNTTLIHLA
jgi:hypothetical protein